MRVEKKNAGFTLIETILYIGLLGILIGGGMIGVYNILEGTGRTRNTMYREQEAYFITRKIDAVISEANSITEPSEGFESDQLTVQVSGPQTITIDLLDEQIRLIRGGNIYELNDKVAPATALNFDWSDASSTMTTTFTLDEHPYSVSNYLP